MGKRKVDYMAINLKRRYKVLPSPYAYYFNKEKFIEQVNTIFYFYDLIEPVFNFNGWYYDRLTKKTWHECDGIAWTYNDKHLLLDTDRDHFLYCLKLYDARILSPAEVDAINVLIKYKLCPQVLRNILNLHTEKLYLRDHMRAAKLAKFRFDKLRKSQIKSYS